jgi:hypothetical protein
MGLKVDVDTALITVSVVASRISRMTGHRERIISKKRSLGVEFRFDNAQEAAGKWPLEQKEGSCQPGF